MVLKHYESFGFFGDDVDYNLIEVIGDTVIENTACRIIERRLLSCNLRPIIDYVFEENGEVFYWHSDTTGFKLLYDFNKEQGESWKIDFYYPEDAIEWFEGDSVIVYVDSVRFVLFNGDTLKVMDVYYSDYCYEDVLIERVGGIQGIFPISHSLCEAFYFRRCYEDSDIGLIKFTQDPCDTTYTSTNDVLVSDNISLSPNPASDILKIDMSDSDFSIQSINIISIEGKVVDSYWDINTPDFIVPFNSFPNGIYLIKIVAEDERVMTSRIVKH